MGGSVPVFDEVSLANEDFILLRLNSKVVISTGLMTNIESVDPSAGVAVCQVYNSNEKVKTKAI